MPMRVGGLLLPPPTPVQSSKPRERGREGPLEEHRFPVGKGRAESAFSK